jgi:transposase
VAGRVRVRAIDDDEGGRLARVVRRGGGPVVTWRRARMVLLSARGMDVGGIAKAAFTGEDRVGDVIRDFNAGGFGCLYPKYEGGRAARFTPGQRREIKKIAESRPADHGLPFCAWSVAELAELLAAEGVAGDISREGLRVMLREEGVTFQRLKTWKASDDPRCQAKKARVEHLHAIAGREAAPGPGEPEIIFCVDESGPLNLQPGRGGGGRRPAARAKSPAAHHGAACERPVPAPPGCGTCSPLTSWARTSRMGTSSRARTGPGSWSSAAACAPSARPGCGSRSSVTTSPPA